MGVLVLAGSPYDFVFAGGSFSTAVTWQAVLPNASVNYFLQGRGAVKGEA